MSRDANAGHVTRHRDAYDSSYFFQKTNHRKKNHNLLPLPAMPHRKKDSVVLDDPSSSSSSDDSDSEGVVSSLPHAPRDLPAEEDELWGSMSAGSMRFAVSAMRKAGQQSLLKCTPRFTNVKDGERLQTELDRVGRRTKEDMANARVPLPLKKDLRKAAHENLEMEVERAEKRFKVSKYMENYLANTMKEYEQNVQELREAVGELEEQGAGEQEEEDDFESPSEMRRALRPNRACPSKYAMARPKARPLADQDSDTISAFMAYSLANLTSTSVA